MTTLLEKMKTYEIDNVANSYQTAFEEELDKELLIPWAQDTGNERALRYISVSRSYAERKGIMNRFNFSLRLADIARKHITKTLPFRRNLLDLIYLRDDVLISLACDQKNGQLSEKTTSLKARLDEKFSDIERGEMPDDKFYGKLFNLWKTRHSLLSEKVENFEYSKPRFRAIKNLYYSWKINRLRKEANESRQELETNYAKRAKFIPQYEEYASFIQENIPKVQEYFRRIGSVCIELGKEIDKDPLTAVKKKEFRDEAYKRAMGSKDEAVKLENMREDILGRITHLHHDLTFELYNAGFLKEVPEFIQLLDFSRVVDTPFVRKVVYSRSLERQVMDEVSEQCLRYRISRAERIFS